MTKYLIHSSLLAGLPQDCWLLILNELSRNDVISLCATSRDLRASSEETLYRHIFINWINPPMDRVVSLLGAILHRPHLATYVKHVEILPTILFDPLYDAYGEWKPSPVWKSEVKSSGYFRKVAEMAKNLVSIAHFPSSQDWVVAIEGGDPHALMTLFLSQLGNLRTLRLDFTFVWQSGWPGRMLTHALSSAQHGLSRFSHLAEVEYGVNAPETPFLSDEAEDYMDGLPKCNPDQFRAWFFLPSLKSLEIWLQSLDGVLDEFASRQTLARLERLVLTHVAASEEQVGRLLSLTGSIEFFHLGLVYHIFHVPRLEPLAQGQALIRGFTPIELTLKHLSLGLQYYPKAGPEIWNKGNPQPLLDPFQGILKHFTALESAELPISMLFGWHQNKCPDMSQLLPGSLQKLCLRTDMIIVDGNEWHLPFLMNTLRCSISSFQMAAPCLTQLAVRLFGSISGSTCRRQISAFNTFTAENGINMSLRLIRDSLPPGLWTGSRDLKEWVPWGTPFEVKEQLREKVNHLRLL